MRTLKPTHPQAGPALASATPPTPGEVAAGAVKWERRGLLSRLVRLR